MGTIASSGGSVRTDYRCAACGYGAVTADVPPACPMCGGSTWNHAAWRPFTVAAAGHVLDAASPVGGANAPTAARPS
jgi:hypothetical protein